MAQTPLDITERFPANTQAAWEALLLKNPSGDRKDGNDAELLAAAIKKLTRQTLDEIAIHPVYTRQEHLPHEQPLHAARRTGRSVAKSPAAEQPDNHPWDIRQSVSVANRKTGNAVILDELERGATSVQLRNIPVSEYRSGNDWAQLLDGVYLEFITLALDPAQRPNEQCRSLLDLYRQKNISNAKTRVAFNIDPLNPLAKDTGHAEHWSEKTGELISFIQSSALELPHSSTTAIDTRYWHNLGANSVQELGIACACGIYYLKAFLGAGMSLEQANRQLVFHLSVDADFFTGIAKLRAMRELWAHVLQQFDATTNDDNPITMPAVLHAYTSSRMCSRLDADNNQLRNTLACSAAAIGGADIISVEVATNHHAPGTEDQNTPEATELARRIARNVGLVLLEESNLHRVVDPMGGSPFIESLTSGLVTRGWQEMQRIEQEGGITAAIDEGSLQNRIEKVRDQRQHDLATGRSPMVGVSQFASLDEQPFANTGSTEQPTMERPADQFEALRSASWAFESTHGRQPVALLLTLGKPSEYRARVGFCQNFLAAGGIATTETHIDSDNTGEPEQLSATLKAALEEATTSTVILCSSDAIYEQLDAGFFKALSDGGVAHVVIAGQRSKLADSCAAKTHCDDDVYLGCHALDKLFTTLGALGVKVETGASTSSAGGRQS